MRKKIKAYAITDWGGGIKHPSVSIFDTKKEKIFYESGHEKNRLTNISLKELKELEKENPQIVRIPTEKQRCIDYPKEGNIQILITDGKNYLGLEIEKEILNKPKVYTSILEDMRQTLLKKYENKNNNNKN